MPARTQILQLPYSKTLRNTQAPHPKVPAEQHTADEASMWG